MHVVVLSLQLYAGGGGGGTILTDTVGPCQ